VAVCAEDKASHQHVDWGALGTRGASWLALAFLTDGTWHAWCTMACSCILIGRLALEDQQDAI